MLQVQQRTFGFVHWFQIGTLESLKFKVWIPKLSKANLLLQIVESVVSLKIRSDFLTAKQLEILI